MTKVGIGVWFQEEVEAILKAIDASNAALAVQLEGPAAETYRAGFVAALQAVAIAFGVTLETGGEAVV